MHNSRLRTALAAAAAFCILFPAVASAQPGAPSQPPPPPTTNPGYYGPPPPATAPVSPYLQRRGLAIGFGIGLGGMQSENGPIDCFNCDYDPVAVGFDFHVGGMINPRLALLLEIWGQAQTLDADGTAMLTQSLAMIGVQYWVTPKLWLKGGIGAAALQISYDDGFAQDDEQVDEGGAIMGAIGYELVQGRTFAMDLQLRIGAGTYEGIDDQITSTTVGLGFNWY
jgi:hypothetical protein